MPASPELLATYAPVAQVAVLYAVLYRNDPLRFLHRSREMDGLRTWTAVLQQLGILEGPVKAGREIKTDVIQALELVLPTALLSALSPLLFLPLLDAAFPFLLRFGTAPLFLLQFVPASYFLVLLQHNYLGPLPIHRHRTTLPLPRMSSMVRCLGRKEAERG